MLAFLGKALTVGKKIGGKISTLAKSEGVQSLLGGGEDGGGNFLSNLFGKKKTQAVTVAQVPQPQSGFFDKAVAFLKTPAGIAIIAVVTLGTGFLIFKGKGRSRRGGW